MSVTKYMKSNLIEHNDYDSLSLSANHETEAVISTLFMHIEVNNDHQFSTSYGDRAGAWSSGTIRRFMKIRLKKIGPSFFWIKSIFLDKIPTATLRISSFLVIHTYTEFPSLSSPSA